MAKSCFRAAFAFSRTHMPPRCGAGTMASAPVSASVAGVRGNMRIRLHGSEWVEDPSWSTPLDPASREQALQELTELVGASKRLLVVTGAGISTASGIPDYRGPQGSYRSGHRPISHQEFVGNFASRQRYWARSMFGFERMADATPNRAHAALALLERAGKVRCALAWYFYRGGL